MGRLSLLNEYRRQRLFASEARNVVKEILPACSAIGEMPPRGARTVERILSTTVDVATVTLRSATDGPDIAVLKLARTSEAERSMRREIEALRRLAAEPRLVELRPVLPRVLASGFVRCYPFLLQQAVPGLDARRILSHDGAAERVQTAAAALVSHLHRQTAHTVVVDASLVDGWIAQRLQAVKALERWHPTVAKCALKIEALDTRLRNSLLGRRMVVSWIHGDLSPGNLLVTPEGDRVTGILDWETTSFCDLPILDFVQLVVSTRVLRERRQMGEVVRTLLEGGALTAHEHRLLGIAMPGIDGGEPLIRDMLLMSWLRHVTDNLSRSARLYRHRWWVRENVESVLAHA